MMFSIRDLAAALALLSFGAGLVALSDALMGLL